MQRTNRYSNELFKPETASLLPTSGIIMYILHTNQERAGEQLQRIERTL